jgi:ATP-dependent Clp protease ATP-binding subunit ClpA
LTSCTLSWALVVPKALWTPATCSNPRWHAANCTAFVEIQLGRVRQRLAERKIHLELTPEARTHLVHTSYDPHYGARPLKRAIQREIETPLGVQLLQGTVRDGQTVQVDYDPGSGALTFTSQTPEAEEEEEAVAAREA